MSQSLPAEEQVAQTTIMPTLQATAAAPQVPSPPSSQASKRKSVAMVEGSTPDFSSEVRGLLRDRLRLVSIIFAVGNLAFLMKALLAPSHEATGMDVLLLWLLTGNTVLMALIAQRLCTGCLFAQRNLRLLEGMVFGASGVFFLVLGYANVIYGAQHHYMLPITVPWLVLIFTYALFIPNTWQRALAAILPMALAPVATLLAAEIFSSHVRELIRTSVEFHHALLEAVMVMTFAATIAVWGVRTIRSLRSQAFEAQQLGHYRLKRLLGRGGMGEVWLAEHRMLKRPCAIKLIRPEKAGDPHTLVRFEQEVQATARLTHWNTVEIFDFGRTEDGTFYYVMEYLPGMNLDHLVREYGPLDPARAVYLLRQTCEALTEAHDEGLVHRDLKPGNIFAARRGGHNDVAKLLDFGLVRSIDREEDMRLTQDGVVTGSPLYLSPEQAQGDVADVRSDIYSLGCVGFYLLTGRPPFDERQPIKLILAHVQQKPVAPSESNSAVPRSLDAIIMKCLEKNPADRYQTTAELRAALLDCEGVGDWSPEQADAWWQQHGCPKKKRLDECICSGRELDTALEQAVESVQPQLVNA